MLAGLRARVSRLGGFTKDLGIRRYKRRAHINFSNHFRSTLEVAIINSYCTNYMGVTPYCYGTRSRADSSTVLVLWVCYLGNHFFCIVNLRPEMLSIATNFMQEVVSDSSYDIKKCLSRSLK